MMGSFPVHFAKGHGDLRNKIHEAEEQIREADAFKGAKATKDAKKVAFMKMLFEVVRLHVRRQGMRRHLLVEQATIKDEEDAAKGAVKQLQEEPEREWPEEGAWVQDDADQ